MRGSMHARAMKLDCAMQRARLIHWTRVHKGSARGQRSAGEGSTSGTAGRAPAVPGCSAGRPAPGLISGGGPRGRRTAGRAGRAAATVLGRGQ